MAQISSITTSESGTDAGFDTRRVGVALDSLQFTRNRITTTENSSRIMYALKARDKYYKREKEREEEVREERRSRNREQHSHHSDQAAGATGGGRTQPSTCCKTGKYMGTFSLQMGSGWKKNMNKSVKQQLSRINPKDTTHAVDVNVSVNIDGVKVISTDGRLVMAHALHRILLSTAEAKKCLFAMVARNPQTNPQEGVYCHIFLLSSKEEANELSQLVGKAFKTAFARNSFKRDKKKPPSLLDGMPSHLPSARPKPWSHSTPSHTHTTPPTLVPAPPDPTLRPPPYAPNATSSGGGEEGGALEVELLSLHSRLYELETRQAHMAGSEGQGEEAMLQLVMEISAIQQQIDEKGKRLHALQQQAAGGSHGDNGDSHGVAGATVGYHDNAMATFPDLESLTLDDAEWFQAGLPREIVMELLSQQPEGAFFVRESSSSPGSYALSMMTPEGTVKHFLIQQEDGQYSISLSGSPNQPSFPSLPALILHHTVDRGPLPCVLSLSTTNPVFSAHEDTATAIGGDFQDHYDYHLLD